MFTVVRWPLWIKSVVEGTWGDGRDDVYVWLYCTSGNFLGVQSSWLRIMMVTMFGFSLVSILAM